MNLFLNTMPKAGTNFVTAVLKQAGYDIANRSLSPALTLGKFSVLRQFLLTSATNDQNVRIGMDVNALVRTNIVRRILKQSNARTYITGHVPYSPEIYSLISENDLRVINLVRNPIDSLLSYCRYIEVSNEHFMFPHFQNKCLSEQIRCALEPKIYPGFEYLGFQNIVREMVIWKEQKNSELFRFEDIIGAPGGGDEVAQRNEIGRLSDILAVKLDLFSINEKAFGKGKTFRNGQIGEGRSALSSDDCHFVRHSLGPLAKTLGYKI